jgi:radical SAM protein with 4Fe4S-binding SPASM domain
VCGVVWRENSDKLSHNVLLPNGAVQSCCCDYGLENTFGNLLTDEYEDLFVSEGYVKMKKAMASEDDHVLCRTCKEVYPDQPYR